MKVSQRSWVWVLGALLAGGPALGQTPGTPAPTGSPGPTPAPPPPQPEKKITLEAVAPSQHALIRQRARQFFKMPDGTVWDGAMFFEYRKILDRTLKPYDRVEPGKGAPGQYIVEDKPLGTVWKFNRTPEVEAWALEENLADKEGVVGGLDRGQGEDRVVPRGLETVDPHSWKEIPSLWTSLEGGTNSWPFAYVDEAEPDVYTRKRHGGYLEITRIWGDGRYEFKGYSLDSGSVDGVVRVDEPKKFVNKDRFKGAFFLWPDGEDPVAKRRLWRLLPAEDARMTPDDLAAALLSGKAELASWGLERVGGKLMWKRTVRDVQEAVVMPPRPKPPPQKPAPNWNDQGPDLVVLSDGRWFRGRVTKKTDQEITILTRVGQGEMPMTFKAGEVKEVQTPEKR